MEIQLQPPQLIGNELSVFGKHEERAIISLAFDQPEFFSSVMSYLKDDYFEQYDTKFVYNIIKYYYETNEVIISRSMCKDVVLDELTADDPHEEIISLIERESDPREVPILTDKMMEWAKKKAMQQLYNRETIESVERGEFEDVERIMEDASKITNIGSKCYVFFNETDKLFDKNEDEKFTSAFQTLDMALNQGGPSTGEVFCWMAPTGKGKSIALVNTGVANIKRGKNVLHVTLEMSFLKTALRYMGCFTDKWIKNRYDQRKEIEKSLASIKATYGGELVIAEYPPEEISVDTIHALLDMLRKLHGIKIDVVIIDYLELLLSRNPAYNKDDYIRQKRVCTEVDRLGKKEKVFVATATQTNRSGNDGQDRESTIGLNKVAESYGKTMPLHYVVSINQTKQEYEDGRQNVGDESSPVTKAQLRFFIAKNRNGPTFVSANARVNYETMKMMEYDSLTSMGADGESSKAN